MNTPATKPETEMSLSRQVTDASPGSRSRGAAAAAQTARGEPGHRPDSVEEKRRQIHDAAHASAAKEEGAAANDKKETEEAAIVVRESVESVELETPSGDLFLFGPPTGIATQFRVASLMDDVKTGFGVQVNSQIVRALISVRAINGKAPPTLDNRVDIAKFANQLGEDTVDLLCIALNQYWPPMTVKDLKVVKKNLR